MVIKDLIHIHGTLTEYPIFGVNDESQIANKELLSNQLFRSILSNKPASSLSVHVNDKHDYEITIERLFDYTTYVLYRLASSEDEALHSIHRVIDVNERVIKIRDLGVVKKNNPS